MGYKKNTKKDSGIIGEKIYLCARCLGMSKESIVDVSVLFSYICEDCKEMFLTRINRRNFPIIGTNIIIVSINKH